MKEFHKEVLARVREEIPDARLTVIAKPNGQSKVGIQYPEENNMAPIGYIDEYAGTAEEVAKAMIIDYRGYTKPNINNVLDWETAKEMLALRFVNKANNTEYLETRPYTQWLDLAIVYALYVGDGMEAVIEDKLMAEWGVTMEELEKAARENAPKVLPCMAWNTTAGYDDLPDMWWVTNKDKAWGATAILYPGVLDEIYEKFGGNMIMIPASVDEFLCVSGDTDNPRGMLRNVNKELDPEDVLSGNVYIYNGSEVMIY